MQSSLTTETARITDLIKRENMGEIETVWVEALDVAPQETDTFIALAEKLYKSGHGEKAGVLLEQLVNKLDELGDAKACVEVLGTLARVAPRNPHQKELAEVVFAKAFEGLAGFDEVVQRAETEAKGHGNRFVRALYNQMKFQPGDWVQHDAGWGIGQVKDIEASDGWLIIDFEEKKDHRVKMGAAAKFFKKLPSDDVRVQREANPEELKKAAKEDPVDLVMNVLKRHNNKSTYRRIRAELVGHAVAKTSFSTWFKEVRKELAKNPFVRIGKGTNPSIELLMTAVTQEEETKEDFKNRIKLVEKLAVLRRYLKDSEPTPERTLLLTHMAQSLVDMVPTDDDDQDTDQATDADGEEQ